MMMNDFPGTMSARALRQTGRQRPIQTVRILTKIYGDRPRYTVAIGDNYYSVGDFTLQQLRMGITPAELGLMAVEPEDEE
jgi:hypothetical protein